MTKEEVQVFAYQTTYSNNRTIVSMIDGEELVGYFNETDLELNSQNKWNFLLTSIVKPNAARIILDGNDIAAIRIVKLY